MGSDDDDTLHTSSLSVCIALGVSRTLGSKGSLLQTRKDRRGLGVSHDRQWLMVGEQPLLCRGSATQEARVAVPCRPCCKGLKRPLDRTSLECLLQSLSQRAAGQPGGTRVRERSELELIRGACHP